MSEKSNDLLRFEEGYFERIWGGEKLKTLFGKPIPPNTPIGEAWLISDHAQCESVVAEGPQRGKTLRALLEEDAARILGAKPRLTVHGRFPLLLKVLDAKDVLSVQVHPDDACAAELGEPDVGKTEMWHVLQSDPGSELICGLSPEVTPETLLASIEDGSIENLMKRFAVREGESVFVSAGTVHAIGAGVVLAEIQQNSDLTYRLYDWRRVDASGKPRALHVEKALRATQFGSEPAALVAAPEPSESAPVLLASCPHFAAESVPVRGAVERTVNGETFHIALVTAGTVAFSTGGPEMLVEPGEALLIPGCADGFRVTGFGRFLDYYVP